MSAFQKTKNGSLESDCPFEMLDRIDALCARLGLFNPIEPDLTHLPLVREHMGDVMAKACEVIWRWPEWFTHGQDCFALWCPEYVPEFVEKHFTSDEPIIDVPLIHENQGCWAVLYRPAIKGVIIDDDEYLHLSHEQLAHTVISFALGELCVHFPGRWHTKQWVAQSELEQNWELLWHRPSYIKGQVVCYLHKSLSVLACASGTYASPTLIAPQQFKLSHRCPPPDFSLPKPHKGQLRQDDHCFPKTVEGMEQWREECRIFQEVLGIPNDIPW